jgi:hypothetical protein
MAASAAFDPSEATAVLVLRLNDGCGNALGASMNQVAQDRDHAMVSQRCWTCHEFLTNADILSEFSMTCALCYNIRRDARAQRFQVVPVGNTDEQQAVLDSFDRTVFKFDQLGVCVVPSCRRTAYLNRHDACVDCCFPRTCWRTVDETYSMADGGASINTDSWDAVWWELWGV